MVDALGHEVEGPEELEELFRQTDLNHSGTVDQKEFIHWWYVLNHSASQAAITGTVTNRPWRAHTNNGVRGHLLPPCAASTLRTAE